MTKASTGSSGSSTFTGLSDGPGAFTGQAGKILQVNAGANALEYTGKPLGPTGFGGPLSGLRMNAAANGFEYGMQRPRFQVTAPGTEIDSSVLVTTGSFTVWKRVLTLALAINVKAGDFIFAHADMEIRNDSGINVEIVPGFLLSPTPTPNEGDDLPVGGQWLAPLNGHDIDPQIHYYNTPKVGGIIVPADIPSPYIMLRVRCRSTSATGAETCTIMPGYGKITALIFPKDGL